MDYKRARYLFDIIKDLPFDQIQVYPLLEIGAAFTKKIDELLDAADDAYYKRLEMD